MNTDEIKILSSSASICVHLRLKPLLFLLHRTAWAILPVRADRASRLSANETTGWKPVGQDRQDACPPATRIAAGLPLALLLFGSLLTPLRAAEAADPALKLREQLRGVTLQLRSSQSECANAQAAQAAADLKTKELADKLAALDKRAAALAKQSNADQAAAAAAQAALTSKLAERDARLAQAAEALDKWKAGYQAAAGIARAKEDERAKLAAEAIVLKRTVADREAKNLALFNTANEILERYQNYALGKALQAREPFIGTTRVKIENLVQGYQDKILDQRIGTKTP